MVNIKYNVFFNYISQEAMIRNLVKFSIDFRLMMF